MRRLWPVLTIVGILTPLPILRLARATPSGYQLQPARSSPISVCLILIGAALVVSTSPSRASRCLDGFADPRPTRRLCGQATRQPASRGAAAGAPAGQADPRRCAIGCWGGGG